MVLKANACLDFVRYSVSKKISFGQNVISCLATESNVFNQLPFSPAVLQNTNDNLNDAQQAAMSGDKVAIQKRNIIVALWNNQFRQTAIYVSLVAGNKVDVIQSAGFVPTKTTRQKKTKIDGIVNFKAAVMSSKGMAAASCENSKDANGYVTIAATDGIQVSMVGDDVIVQLNGGIVRITTSTQGNVSIAGLQSGQRVNISMFAFNAAGSSPLTNAQSVLPQ